MPTLPKGPSLALAAQPSPAMPLHSHSVRWSYFCHRHVVLLLGKKPAGLEVTKGVLGVGGRGNR